MSKSRRASKSPNDYPLFGCRFIPEISLALTSKLEEAVDAANEARPKGDKPLKKNDVFKEALEIGFEAIKKNGVRKR